MKRILIIEDNDSLREDLIEALSYEGFYVLKANSGIIGLELAKNEIPDLVLCDVMMPEMDGFKVLEILKKEKQTRLIPFIFITSLADRAYWRNGMELGADDYLTKPFTISELVNAINARLDRYFKIQIGSTLDSIEHEAKQRLRILRKQIECQKNELSEISGANKQLKDQLRARETELFETVVQSIETGNILSIFRSQIEKEISRTDISLKEKEFLKGLSQKISRIGSKKDNWRIFQIQFNHLYPDFIPRILQKHPNLTQLDVTIISAIIMNLNSSQIAGLLTVSTDSVRKNKYRLKRKLKLDKDTNLINFIHGMKFIE